MPHLHLHLPHAPHFEHHQMRYERMYPALMLYAAILFFIGILLDSPSNILLGLQSIILSEDALITDYVQIAGPGAALVNSAIVTALTVKVLHLSDEVFNGITLVVVGLMSGFALFGKNFLNILPIIFGTFLYSRHAHQPFRKFAAVSFMCTALAPLVSYIALDNGFGNLFMGVLTGIVIGFILPPLAAYTYRIQNGMNLYNVGFACGLIAMMIVPLISSLGGTPTIHYHWASGYNMLFGILLTSLCLTLILLAFTAFHLPPWAVWAGYRRLLHTSGRSPSDYLRMFGPAPVMINTGVNGIVSMICLLMLGGDLNGPTVGGILTIMGFSSFGKHVCNILPPMFGVVLGSLMMHWSLDDSATQLALLFCTTLAPISGYFGWPYGILAGFLHASCVLFTSGPVAGMNLYNNGFSGGLVAIVLYPLIIAIARHRKIVIQDEDFFEPLDHDEPMVPPAFHEIVEDKDI